ncbi:hypothetical protein B5F34_15445 [Mediterranea sp. An20]|nr:hypothetical protein B5F34_15445 [Mediterranea sp. An20]
MIGIIMKFPLPFFFDGFCNVILSHNINYYKLLFYFVCKGQDIFLCKLYQIYQTNYQFDKSICDSR